MSETISAVPAIGITPQQHKALDDPRRLAVLEATGLLDSPPEAAFDRLTRLASRVLEAPLALVNLVDERRQFAKSCFAPPGWPDDPEAPLADSYCRWTVIEREPVVIADARLDPRVSDSHMLSDLGVISYLGIPLLTPEGIALGSLCVAGFEPRSWTEEEIAVLQDLAASVVSEVLLRLDARERRQVERLKDELVSIVAHELRTPLTSIRGSLGLLASGRLDPQGEQGRRLLEIAAQNSDRLVRLINDMLDLERLESGSIELDPREVSAQSLVKQAFDAVHDAAERAGVRLVCVVPEHITLLADPDRVMQVLINLVSNAVKFSESGSEVRVTAEARGSEALLQVVDHGRGIPADKLESIFGRFHQVDSSDSRALGGTGLGLAITRTIARQHGGRVWAASEPGKGSTFFVTLPLAPPHPFAD